MKAQRPRLAWQALGLAVLLLAGQGCSLRPLYRPHIYRLSPGFHTPRPPDYPISLTEADYRESYIEIAEVTTSPYDDRLVDSLGRSQLRDIARKLGGDAVIRITRNSVIVEETGYRPGALLRYGTRFVDKQSLTGVVVRFKRDKGP